MRWIGYSAAVLTLMSERPMAWHSFITPINDHPALSSISTDGEGYVTIMLMVDDEFTLVVGVGAMTLDEVRQIASRVRLVDTDEWQAHGGQFIECVWLAPDCDAIPPKYQTTTTTARPITKLTTTTLDPDWTTWWASQAIGRG